MDFFTTERLNEHLTCITDLTGVHMFLVEGKKKAALIDTGTGIGDLAAFVSGLTRLPLTVILTHGHVDHAGGSSRFDGVFLNPKDRELAGRHCTVNMKKGYASFTMREKFSEVTEDEIAPAPDGSFRDLEDGMEFDLGGITLRAVAVPGHTKGMTCILFVEDRTLLIGDACNSNTFLFDADALSVPAYQESLLQLQKKRTDFDRVMFSHGPVNGPVTVIDDCLECCSLILAGKADDIPFDFMGERNYRAKAADPATMLRKDGKLGNIIYHK